MSGHVHANEYEHEPVRGLPEQLPEGEEILWQGSPDWRGLSLRAFHTRKVAVYFSLLLLWSAVMAVWEAQPLAEAAASVARLALLGVVAIGILTGFAWLSARATVYTVTNRRVVMRFGVALAMAVNLPFRRVESADLRMHPDGSGDICLRVSGAEKLGSLMMWPHVRPWRISQGAQPMLRCVPQVGAVAEKLSGALAESATSSARRETGSAAPSLASAAA